MVSLTETSTETSYEGSGSFYDGRGNDVPSEFVLRSHAEDLLDQTFQIGRRGSDGKPSRGQYAFGRLKPDQDGSLVGLTVLYTRVVDDIREKCMSVDGDLHELESSGARIEGVFNVQAVLYCRLSTIDWEYESHYEGSCRNPHSALDVSGPRIDVIGRFDATVMETLIRDERWGGFQVVRLRLAERQDLFVRSRNRNFNRPEPGAVRVLRTLRGHYQGGRPLSDD